MKSKIFFDIDNLNNPLIRVRVSFSQDDIRDKVVQRFFDNANNGENMPLIAKIIGHSKSATEAGSMDLEIYPVSSVTVTN